MGAVRMILTRPERASERFARSATARFGASVDIVISPVLDVVPCAAAVDFDGIAGLIVTSENGVEALASLGPVPDLPVWCVGPRTSSVARARGLVVKEGPGTAAGLVDMLGKEPPSGPLVHLRGVHVSGDLAGALTAAGVPVRSVVVYDQVPRPLSADAKRVLSGHGPCLLPVFSPRSARLLAGPLRGARAELRIAAMSHAVAGALSVQSGTRMRVADRPDATAMLDTLDLLLGG